MSGLELVARLADALAWPVFALIIAVVLRHPLSQALSRRPLSKVKAGPFEVEWDRTAAETEKEVEAIGISAHDVGAVPGALREELAGEAASTPVVAVLEAHATIERTLRDLLNSTDMPAEQTRRLGAVGLARLAQRQGLLTPETVKAVEGISVMRNLAAHGSAREITPHQAVEYLTLADAVLYAIRHKT
jgi:hypothetical protein